MRILLPPSETKRSGGGGAFHPETLSFDALLGSTRREVRSALETLSRDEPDAVKALKLGAKSRGELAHNLALGAAPAMPAIERYTGVLYDALDAPSLSPTGRQWVDAHVLVQSALFGLIAAPDRIPQYRLSASSKLPGLSLKSHWREAHAALDWASLGWVLDLRSNDYAALAPVPPGLGQHLAVASRGPEGRVRALNHFNKAAKGDLVRRLAESGAQLDGPESFTRWAQREGLEVIDEAGTLTLVTTLGAPASTPAFAP